MASKALVRVGQRKLRFERLDERAMLACTLADSLPCLPASEGPDSGVVGATAPVDWQSEETGQSAAEEAATSPVVETPQPRVSPFDLSLDDEIGPVVEFQLTFVDMAGNPISSIEVGESFRLVVQVYDLTSGAVGIHSAYLDITYDASLATFDVKNAPMGLNGIVRSFASEPGLLNNVGGMFPESYDSDTGLAVFDTEELAFDGTFEATSPGEIRFTARPSAFSDPNEGCLFPAVLLFGYEIVIPLDRITFGVATLDIYPEGEPPADADILPPAPAEIPNQYSYESFGMYSDGPFVIRCDGPSDSEDEPDVLPEPVETPETIVSQPFDEISLTTGPIDLDVVTLKPPIELPSDLPGLSPLDLPHGKVVSNDLLDYFSPTDSDHGVTTGLHRQNESSANHPASDRWSQAEYRAVNRRTARAVDYVFTQTD